MFCANAGLCFVGLVRGIVAGEEHRATAMLTFGEDLQGQNSMFDIVGRGSISLTLQIQTFFKIDMVNLPNEIVAYRR